MSEVAVCGCRVVGQCLQMLAVGSFGLLTIGSQSYISAINVFDTISTSFYLSSRFFNYPNFILCLFLASTSYLHLISVTLVREEVIKCSHHFFIIELKPQFGKTKFPKVPFFLGLLAIYQLKLHLYINVISHHSERCC